MTLEHRALVAIASAGGLVIDAGGGVPFGKGMAPYRPIFAGADYRTLDVDSATHPDVVGDIHDLPLADGSVDAFVCRSVLEHVADPRQAAREMHRALRPGGQLLVTVPSIYPYHARDGAYPDLWRFFEGGLRLLLEDFEEVLIEPGGGPATAVVMFAPAFNRHASRLGPLAQRADRAIARRRGGVRNPSTLTAWATR